MLLSSALGFTLPRDIFIQLQTLNRFQESITVWMKFKFNESKKESQSSKPPIFSPIFWISFSEEGTNLKFLKDYQVFNFLDSLHVFFYGSFFYKF